MLIEIVLPCIPPSLNSAYRYLRGGRVLTPRYREFKKCVEKVIGKAKMPWKYCTVDIEFRAPDKRRRDVDNYLKALFDALTGSGFWLDDSQVVSMNVKLVEPGNKNSSYTIIKIEEKDGYDRPRDFGEETPSGVYNL